MIPPLFIIGAAALWLFGSKRSPVQELRSAPAAPSRAPSSEPASDTEESRRTAVAQAVALHHHAVEAATPEVEAEPLEAQDGD